MYGAFMIRTRMVYYDADTLYLLDYRTPKDPSIPSQLRLPASIHLRNAEREKNVWSAPGTHQVRVEIMGSPECRIVGKSQSVLMMINPIIFTRTRSS